VIVSNTIRPTCKFTLVVIGVAISVFVWGLQYKLSLYFPAHSVYHQVPEAKLLSKNEQPTRVEGVLAGSTKPFSDTGLLEFYTLTLFAWVLALPALAGRRHTKQERKKPWLVALSASLDAFFFRPPPSASSC
jgi:hypothetical protein